MLTYFITMAGLEERFQGGLDIASKECDRVVVFRNTEDASEPQVMANQEAARRKLTNLKPEDMLDSSYKNPFVMIREFNRLASSRMDELRISRVVLDISTFNRQNLLVLLRLLRQVYRVPEVEILYTIPMEVNPHLSKGASGYSNVPFLGGDFTLGKRKLLLLLVGYELDRPLFLWRELEPSKVLLAEGLKPTAEGFYKANKEAVDRLERTGRCERLSIAADDPLVARDQLCELFEREAGAYNIVASPLNTKLQAVGLYLAWERHPSVQVVMSYPDKFDDWLSKGIREVRMFKI